MNLKKWINYLPEALRYPLIRSKIKLGHDLPTHIIIKLAETKEELEQAFQILHDAYVDEAYMDAQVSGLRMTKYHALPTTAVLIAKDSTQNKVVATLSMIRNSKLGLPLDAVCSLKALKEKYPSLTEISSLAIDKEYRKDPTLVFWPLMRAVFRYAKDVMGIEAYVIGVHPKRHDLYKGILGFNQLENSQVEEYGFVKNAPVVAYVADLQEQAEWFAKKYAKLPQSANWHKYCVQSELSSTQYQFISQKYYGVQKSVMNSSHFKHFFQEKTENAKTLLSDERSIVEKVLSVGSRFSIEQDSNVIPLSKCRQSERFHTKLQGKVFSDAELTNSIDATVQNLSASGIGLQTTLNLPESIFLKVSIGQNIESVLQLKIKNKLANLYGCEILTSDNNWVEFMNSVGSAVSENSSQRAG